MHFLTQLGVLAIILIILVILIKSNQTLEQIYMEDQWENTSVKMPSFKISEFIFANYKKYMSKKNTKYKPIDETEKEETNQLRRSAPTIPREKNTDWYVEIVDVRGNGYARKNIEEYPFTLGRDEENDYVIEDLSVSGFHASLNKEDGMLILKDKGSLNKLFVDGKETIETDIYSGIKVGLGNTVIRFVKEGK